MDHIKRIGALLFLLCIGCACKSQINVLAGVPQNKIAIAYFENHFEASCDTFNFWVFKDGTMVYKTICDERGTTEIETKITSAEMNALLDYLEGRILEQPATSAQKNIPVTILKYDGKEYVYHTSLVEGTLKDVNSKIENLIAQTIR